MAISAHDAKQDAQAAAVRAATTPAASTRAAPSVGAVATPSFAGIAPADANTIAMRHAAYCAVLPAAPPGPVARVHLPIADRIVTIAPGIRYRAWTFGGTVPGPVIHVREGQKVVVTLTNRGTMAHSVDFHAAQVAPNVDFSDIGPGASKTFGFVAKVPGVFMYHCGTAPTFVHIANGMYSAIVVEPSHMPPTQHQYVPAVAEHGVPRRRLHPPARLAERGPRRRAAARHPDRRRARGRRRRVRRDDPECRPLSVRLA